MSIHTNKYSPQTHHLGHKERQKREREPERKTETHSKNHVTDRSQRFDRAIKKKQK